MNTVSFIRQVWSMHAQRGDYFCLSTKSVMSGKWKDHFFEWPIKAQLREFFESYSEEKFNLYFCPTPFTKPRRKKEYVRGSRLLWSDLDEIHPNKSKPVPSIAWESSPDRYAALWMLIDFYDDLEMLEQKNKALTYRTKADASGWDLTQVLRIPNTLNHKYKGSPRGKLLWFREKQYGLDDIADTEQSDLDPLKVLKKWRRKLPLHLYRTLTAKRATIGKRSEVLWRLEVELVDLGLDADEIYTLIKHSVWNKFSGRRDEEHQLRREIEKAVETRPDDKKRKTLAEAAEGEEEEPGEEKGDIQGRIVRMSDIEEEQVKFLWKPYIPLGKVTIVEGDPGLGKSWLTTAIAAAVSRHRRLPAQEKSVRGRTLIMSAEDGLADTLKGRLRLLGANSRRIFAYNLEHEEGLVKIDDIGAAEIEEEVRRLQPKLLIIDPLVAYMGADVDMHRANETRELMTLLARIAARCNIAVVVVRHLRKGSADKSIYRGLGSIDLTAAARSVLIVGRDPEDADGRIMCHIKCNVAELGDPIRYFLHRKSKRPFRWGGPCDVSVDDVLSSDKTPQGKSEADLVREFLEEAMKRGGSLAETIKRDAEARSLNFRTVERVRTELKIRIAKRNGELWWLPH